MLHGLSATYALREFSERVTGFASVVHFIRRQAECKLIQVFEITVEALELHAMMGVSTRPSIQLWTTSSQSFADSITCALPEVQEHA